MKKTIFLVVSALILGGCAAQNLSKNDSGCQSELAAPACEVEKIKIPSSFKADLLCPECTSATSVITLNADNTFKIESIFHKKSTQRILESGKFSLKNNIITTTNQYKETAEYKFDGVNLIKLVSKNSFIKDPSAQQIIYKPMP